MSMQQECVKQVEVVKKRMETEKYAEERPTIFSTLLSEEDKPDGYRIPSTMELKDEAYSVLAAAADTTGNAMTVAAFNVIRTPQIYQTLAQELAKAFPDPNAELSFIELERLPYLASLSAVPFSPHHVSNKLCSTLDRLYQRSSPPLLRRHRPPPPGRPRPWHHIQRLLRAGRYNCRHVILDHAPQPGHLP
jgi:hypothetical protein